jgi:hypothetical protein
VTSAEIVAEEAPTATIEPVVKELDSRIVDTDKGRYSVRLLWRSTDNTLVVTASVIGGEEVATRKVPRHMASEAMRHPVVYLNLI